VRTSEDGRRERLEVLYDEHGEAVLRYALRRADADTAADVLAETFLVAWRRIDRVPASARPWLLGVARRVLANHRRGERRRLALLARLAAEPAAPSPAAAVDVPAAIRRLAVRDREALMLVHWDGLTPSEAAKVAGCTPIAFRSRLHRAHRRLARDLDPADGAEEGAKLVRA
jgi:RNA polymerase sigma factor (sigma-70 family)